jgi:hypothetical protein
MGYQEISRRSFLKLTEAAVSGVLLPSRLGEMNKETESQRSRVRLESYSSSEPNLQPQQQERINKEAKSAFDFANTTLKGSFPADVEGFSVVGVTPLLLQRQGWFRVPTEQVLINLLGRDKTGEFAFNLLKTDRYYPLFNPIELPPTLTEKPERMPVVLMPNKGNGGTYMGMWNETAFQICPTADRSVFVLPTKNIPQSRLAAWLMDFSGDELQDRIYDGREYSLVEGGIPEDKIVTASGEYKPSYQKFNEIPNFGEPFYINRKSSLLTAYDGRGRKIARAKYGSKGRWEWQKSGENSV